MSYLKAKKIADQFNGWLTSRESKFLYDQAKKSPKRGVIVEIGSWQGKSTTYLAYGSREGNKNKVYAIDPHINSIEQKNELNNNSSLRFFKENMKKAKIEDLVFPIIKKSEEAAKNWKDPIALLWIDGDHSYNGAKSDFDLFSPFVVEGGIIAFHDSTQKDRYANVPRVVIESFRKKGFVSLGLVDTIAHAKKTSDKKKNLKDHLIIFIIKRYHFFRKLKILKRWKNNFKKYISRF